MEDSIREEIAIKIKLDDIYYDNGVRKFRDTNLPLNGKYKNEYGVIAYFKNGKWHNENGPAVIFYDGVFEWWINDYHIEKVTMNAWLTENDIPLDWNIWSDLDKMLFALHWSDYSG